MSNPDFVCAQQARTDIEKALASRREFSDVKATIISESEDDWAIELTASSPYLILLGFIPVGRVGKSVTVAGNRHHEKPGTMRATMFGAARIDPQNDAGPLYTVWTILDCEYAWIGDSYADLLKALGGKQV